MTKNLHIEHPEDLILTGDLRALDCLYDFDHASVKIDGSPAIVWGEDPATGTFFVGTKAVFNKVKIRIAHSHAEIDQYYQGEVATILHKCFDYLPRLGMIVQGDFIGFGGSDQYEPNTITYKFEEEVYQEIIIAPHTVYKAKGDLRNAIAAPMKFMVTDTSYCKMVCPSVDWWSITQSRPAIDTSKVQFMTVKEATEAKKKINALIRQDIPLSDSNLFDILGDVYLVNLYQLVIEIKEDLLNEFFIVHDCPKAFLYEDVEIRGEGYVISNDDMSLKLVDRASFANANFNNTKYKEVV